MQLKLYKSVLVIFSDDVIAQAISHSQAHSVEGKGVSNNNVFASFNVDSEENRSGTCA